MAQIICEVQLQDVLKVNATQHAGHVLSPKACELAVI